MRKLEVPDEALRPLLELYPDYESDEDAREDARLIAAPILAVFLDGLATSIEQGEGSHRWQIAERVRLAATRIRAEVA